MRYFFVTIVFFLTINCLFAQIDSYDSEFLYNSEDSILDKKSLKKNRKVNSLSDIFINEFMAINNTLLADEFEEYDDWIELYNFSDHVIDIKGCYLTDDFSNPSKWQIKSSLLIQPSGYVIIWADNEPEQGVNHVGFKLSGAGEQIGLFSENLKLIDKIIYLQQRNNISYGRLKNDFHTWNYFTTPTPCRSNFSNGLMDVLLPPVVSHQGGYYNDEINLVMRTANSDETIYYTLDGSEPDQSSMKYKSSIKFENNMVVRSRVFKENFLPSRILTHTYFFSTNTQLPVISISTNHTNLWGESGIYSHPLSNEEKPVHIEYFEDKKIAFSLDCGLKMHGVDGREQKSLRIHARSEYGTPRIVYPIFKHLPIVSFKRLILRNAGNDGLGSGSDKTHFRDPFLHVLNQRTNKPVTGSAYQAVNVYINGDYWGIYNLRERQDLDYIQSHFEIQDAEIDFLELGFDSPDLKLTIEGDWDKYTELIDDLMSENLNSDENYNYLKEKIDIDAFINYWIAEVYAGNFDWIANNTKMWCSKSVGGKWRWILWDLDHGIGLPYKYNSVDYGSASWNSLDHSTTLAGTRTGGRLNIIIRRLLENSEFRKKFIVRYEDLLNTYYSAKTSEFVIDSIYNSLYYDMSKHVDRWNSSMDEWNEAVDNMKSYVRIRPNKMMTHLRKKFSLGNLYKIIVQTNPPEAGKIDLNTITANDFPWIGLYYDDIPLDLLAIPASGYEFVGWSDNITTQNHEVKLQTDSNIVAIFKPVNIDAPIVINEINFNSGVLFNSADWIELYNPSSKDIDISEWVLKNDNSKQIYQFPKNTILNSNNYLVICEDLTKFNNVYSKTLNVVGDLDFGLDDNLGNLMLYNNNSQLIDEVYYNYNPFFINARGVGYTVELTSWARDNSKIGAWRISSKQGGTPGSFNKPDYGDVDFPVSVNIFNPNDSQEILIYPNPANDYIYIRSSNFNDKANIRIYNIFGQLEKSVTAPLNERIDISELSNGIYLIIVNIKNQIISEKIIIAHE